MLSDWQRLKQEVERGILGKTQGVPICLPKIGKYLSIRQSVYTLIGGFSGCLAKGTGVIMFNGTIKPVEDIIPGDVLMGPDSTARIVQELKRGVQQMYWIRQNKGEDYEVNEDHILHLRKIRTKYKKKVLPNQLHIPKNKRKRELTPSEGQTVETCNISVKNVLKSTKTFLSMWNGYKVGIEMSEREVDIEPYMLGVWLGDGSSSKPDITNVEKEITDYIIQFANKNGYKVSKNKITYSITKTDGKCRAVIGTLPGGAISVEYNSLRDAVKDLGGAETNISAAIKTNTACRNYYWKYKDENRDTLRSRLARIGVLNNKHIPDNYKYNSRENRLQLLAGIIDTDGYSDGKSYQITQKNKRLAEDVVYLCRSLGYYTSITEKTATMKRENGSMYKCQVYKLEINGNNLCEVPCKVERKRIKRKSTRVTDALSTGIKIEKSEIKEYYGFTLDKDHLFLLSDFTVTHNTGKTSYADSIYVLEPYMWLLENKDKTDQRIEWIYWSMERKKIHKLSKWACYYIWRKYGVLIEPAKLMGWRKDKIDEREKAYFDKCEEFFETMQDSKLITIMDVATNPRGIYKHAVAYMQERGVETKVSEYKTEYTLNNPNLIVQLVLDTIGKCNLETVDGSKDRKSTTDKMSEYFGLLRDIYHMSPIAISQFNTSITSQLYGKVADPEPTPESYKNSGNMFEDCDVGLALFNPYRYKVYNHMDHDIPEFIDKSGGPHHGANYFRSLKLLKSSYSEDDLRFGLSFMGQIGYWKDLPRPNEIEEYNNVAKPGEKFHDNVKNLMWFVD